jgi:hypothetical protein
MSPWFAVAMCIWFWVALASQALIGHWLQGDVAEWMAARAERTTGAEQGPALAMVQDLLKAQIAARRNP